MLFRILAIVRKEFVIELRKQHVLFGVLLFAITIVYLLYKSFNTIKGLQWDVLLWIVLLFSGINAVAKSFTQEGDGTRLYYYTLFDPQEVFLGKVIYNFLFVMLLFLLVYGGFAFFLENPIKDMKLFLMAAAIGGLGLSIIFTFISSVSSQGGSSNAVLMSVMALPLSIPILLQLIKVTAVSMRLMQDSAVSSDLIIMAGIDLLLGGLALILFNELWKD